MSKKTTKTAKAPAKKAAATAKTKSGAKTPAAKKPVAVAKPKAAKKVAWPSGPKAFEKACAILGIKPILPGVKGLPKKHAGFILSGYILTTVIEATNKLILEPSGEFPNYFKTDQRKHFRWRYVKATEQAPGGVGFSNTDDGYTDTFATVGSRFFFKTPEARDHLERPEFKKHWIAYLLIPKE